jgi:uncharacterized protein
MLQDHFYLPTGETSQYPFLWEKIRYDKAVDWRFNMILLIEKNKTHLEELCKKYHVQKLELFGSAVTNNFDPANSDLDFLVQFQPLNQGELFAFYFDLLNDLRNLFGLKIDLITSESVNNPHLQKAIAPQRKTLYAA